MAFDCVFGLKNVNVHVNKPVNKILLVDIWLLAIITCRAAARSSSKELGQTKAGAAGIEPASANPHAFGSTCLDKSFDLTGYPPTDRLTNS